MKVLKMLKYVLVLTVIVFSTSCNPEEVEPKQTGESDTQVDGASGDD